MLSLFFCETKGTSYTAMHRNAKAQRKYANRQIFQRKDFHFEIKKYKGLFECVVHSSFF